MNGIIGRKIGMTQVYDDEGRRISVTVIEAGPCPVVQVKTDATDGYRAAQLGFAEQKPQRMSKAEVKHCEKAGVKPQRILKEFDLDEGEQVAAGETVTVSIFDGVKYVDVSGITKGRGFAGVVRRYRMGGGPMTHGGHSKRRVGSIGARDLPGWVEKGKKMPGHMGAVNRKVRNLRVIQVRGEDNLILVEGSIPGAKQGIVFIRKALRK
ncbi:MAG: 50S ribosomal protein L3 [Kiritimatiellaeota bacterium]|nr:50S ribosomal protein L3 [Kiritimatiellota bacterium]